MNVVVVDAPASVEPLKMRYPVTPILSVEAVQDSETVVEVVAVTMRFVGGVGGVVSTIGGAVVTITGLVGAGAFVARAAAPAASGCGDGGGGPVARTGGRGPVAPSRAP